MKIVTPAYSFSFIAVDKLLPDPTVPQRGIDHEKDEELSNSVARSGILEPLLVRNGEDGNVFVMAGQRRLRAARRNHLPQVPCVHVEGDPVTISILENIHRNNLSPLEEADAFHQLMTSLNCSHAHLGKILGKAQSTVTEILSIHELCDAVKERVREIPNLSKSFLVEIAKKTPEEQKRLLEKHLEGRLSRDDLRGHTRHHRSSEEICIGELRKVSTRLDRLPLHVIEDRREELHQLLEELQKKLEKVICAITYHRHADDVGDDSYDCE